MRPNGGARVLGVALGLVMGSGCLTISEDEHAAWMDRDGDGVDGTIDCNDADPSATEVVGWFLDNDLDGLGNAAMTLANCGQPEGYTSEPGDDCDDAAGVFEPLVWYADVDGDGFGDENTPVGACTQPAGYVEGVGDCNDRVETTYPDAPETCNAADDDCDGFIDEEGATGTSTWFPDEDGDGHGTGGGTVQACSPPSGFVETSDDCDDTDPEVSPSDVEVCGDEVDNDCDGTINGCRPTGTIDAIASAASLIEGITSDSGVGSALDARDFDGDGELDLLVGADLTGGGKGALYLVEGPLDRPVSLLTEVEMLGATGDYAGSGVVFLDDWDGDGVTDLAVGGRQSSDRDADDSPLAQGRVYVVSGALARTGTIASAALLTFNGTNGSRPGDDGVGENLASLGDIDGDGLADLAVATPMAEPVGSGNDRQGAVYLLHGPTSGTLEAASTPDIIWGEQIQDLAGAAVATVDADSDGDRDLVIGSSWRYESYPGGGSDPWPGGLDFFFDAPSGSVTIIDGDASFLGTTLGEGFGSAIAPLGDIDGDGHEDLLIGAVGGYGDPVGNPAAYLVHGPFMSDDAVSGDDATLTYPYLDDQMADVVSTAGDFDGDGTDDVAISGAGASEVWIHYGPVAGTVAIDDGGAQLVGGVGEELGRAMVGGFDIDSDGIDDLFVGVPGYTGGAGVNTGAVVLLTGYNW